MRRLPVLLRQEALADLEEIFAHLVETGADAAVVMGFVRRIRQKCEAIGEVPEGYPARPNLGPGIRIAPFERSAVIAYRIADGAVEIVSIFYGGRDYDALMRTD
ncbi:type II toxin-antitoxin system RelE/ParE family toxin [Pelagibacterium lacus]|uniref:Type II toxin-antitoxin system RelE/ParE family toxin n=1 Tax=Pelagibacterium lacus TaxID=2282655 RepID=A0A369WAV4_9HYPH|nr:type II toxin-antitoxin system RelE/ParE family toxin [Pelagibacterium lacus]RDE10432.1 type II toxin-antitoxin system RelE/ParE family toxin [Pelagibacterium lacus]